jgi:micrococcal nuclease
MSIYEYGAKVLRVIDGDTLDLEIDLGFEIRIRERIRLIGIDTPETYGAKASPEGKLATAFTKSWVDGHANFHLSSTKYNQREKYGRVLGVLYRDGDTVSLNDALLNSGNAKIVTY